MFTVYDIINMFLDPELQEFSLWSNEKEKVIFKGYLEDLPEDLEKVEVTSIDNITENMLVLNIDEE